MRAVVAILFLATVTMMFFAHPFDGLPTDEICPLPGTVLEELSTDCVRP